MTAIFSPTVFIRRVVFCRSLTKYTLARDSLSSVLAKVGFFRFYALKVFKNLKSRSQNFWFLLFFISTIFVSKL